MKACINYNICKCNPDIKSMYCDKIKGAMKVAWDMGNGNIPNSDFAAQDNLGNAMKPIIELLNRIDKKETSQ